MGWFDYNVKELLDQSMKLRELLPLVIDATRRTLALDPKAKQIIRGEGSNELREFRRFFLLLEDMAHKSKKALLGK